MSDAARSKRYRDRKAGKLDPLPQCSSCGRQCRSDHGGLCSRCWVKLTDEGRAANREWTKQSRRNA